jgi:hypothetical protein
VVTDGGEVAGGIRAGNFPAPEPVESGV